MMPFFFRSFVSARNSGAVAITMIKTKIKKMFAGIRYQGTGYQNPEPSLFFYVSRLPPVWDYP